MKVRVKFRKYGPVRFIGHLDVMRFFQKCIRRAEIDVAYTTGFSPHQIMTFAAPLGVGLTSDGEYMDIECYSVTTSEEMIERFNRASVPGIEIVSVVMLPEDAGNAMASVAAAAYRVRFREDREPAFDYRAGLAEFYAMSEITILKETKKSTLQWDIRPGLYELWAEEDGAIHMLVDASSGGNIKPAQVMRAYMALQGETLEENALVVHRKDTYLNLAPAGSPQRLAPMDAIGSPILAPMRDEKRIQITREALRRREQETVGCLPQGDETERTATTEVRM
ncbi:MAG: TIGR03936 family radical SAM-associated protein [bacterium]|nr:TIGR03936 family radical SAM-associated protein [bacterium]MCM1375761.1 TIGR03936 family radical SAM-associated protein [Muribaculum sp.]